MKKVNEASLPYQVKLTWKSSLGKGTQALTCTRGFASLKEAIAFRKRNSREWTKIELVGVDGLPFEDKVELLLWETTGHGLKKARVRRVSGVSELIAQYGRSST